MLPDRGQDAVAAAAGGSSGGSSGSSGDSSALAVCAAAAALTGALIFQALGMLHADIHARNVLVAWEEGGGVGGVGGAGGGGGSGESEGAGGGGGAPPPPRLLRLSLCDFGSALPLARAPPPAGQPQQPQQQLCYTGAPRGGRWDAMPLEQFGSGRHANEGAVTLTPGSDVFCAGVVLASLWRRRGGVMPFAEEAGAEGGMGAALRKWLDAATHPEAAQRPGDAAAALAGLLQACSADEAGGGGGAE